MPEGEKVIDDASYADALSIDHSVNRTLCLGAAFSHFRVLASRETEPSRGKAAPGHPSALAPASLYLLHTWSRGLRGI